MSESDEFLPNTVNYDPAYRDVKVNRELLPTVRDESAQRQIEVLATLKERERLAREMHDQVAQALGLINLKASLANEALTQGQIDQVRTKLLELKQMARDAYTDVREAIFNLRQAPGEHEAFLAGLQTYLADYQTHYDVSVDLIFEGEETIELAPSVGIQIVRIIQEALSNVRKHAATDWAQIHFELEGDRVCVTITDEGRGFDPSGLNEGDYTSFGLQIMRERVESIGGTLNIESVPSQGTTLQVRFPIQ